MVKMSYSLAWSLVQLYSCLAFRLTRLAGITVRVRSVQDQDQEGVVGGSYDAGHREGREAKAGGGCVDLRFSCVPTSQTLRQSQGGKGWQGSVRMSSEDGERADGQ